MTTLDPARLVFVIIAPAAWWFSVSHLARMLTRVGGLVRLVYGARSPRRVRACVLLPASAF